MCVLLCMQCLSFTLVHMYPFTSVCMYKPHIHTGYGIEYKRQEFSIEPGPEAGEVPVHLPGTTEVPLSKQALTVPITPPSLHICASIIILYIHIYI